MTRKTPRLGTTSEIALALALASTLTPTLSGCDRKAKAGESCEFDKECPAEHLCFGAKCTATSEVMEVASAACKAEPLCKEMGQCSPRLVGYQTTIDQDRWKCHAVTDQDCAGSKVCKDEDLCRAQNDLCTK